MGNIFDQLGSILGKGFDAIGKGMAAERMGPDYAKKAEMLGRLNEIEIATKAQEPELRRTQVESMAYNRRALEDAARENTKRRRIQTLTEIFSGPGEPRAELYQGMDPLEIAAARQSGENARRKSDYEMGKGETSFSEPTTIGGRTFEPGRKYNKEEISALLEIEKERGRNQRDVTGGTGSEPMVWVDAVEEDGSPVLDAAGNPVQELVPRSQGEGRRRVKSKPVALIGKDQAFKASQPVLKTIADLSGKIKIGEGPGAFVKGTVRSGAAKVNLDNDMNRYRAAVRGFAPLLARALGHTGVLTEQDVNRTEELFGKPGESDTLRASKIELVRSLLAAVNKSQQAGLMPPDDDQVGFETRLNAVLGSGELQVGGSPGSDIDEIESLLRNR